MAKLDKPSPVTVTLTSTQLAIVDFLIEEFSTRNRSATIGCVLTTFFMDKYPKHVVATLEDGSKAVQLRSEEIATV